MKGLKLKKLSRDIGLNVTRQVLKILLLLLLTIIIARALGPDGNGKYNLAILLPMFLARFINFGIGNANSYYIGKGSVSLHAALKLNWLLGVILSVIGLLVGTGAIHFLDTSFFAELPRLMLYTALVGFPFFLIKILMSSLLQAVQDFKKFNSVLLAEPIVILGLVVLLILILGKGVIAAVGAFIGGQVISSAIAIYLVRVKSKDIEEDIDKGKEITRKKLRSYIFYGGKAHLSNILTFLIYRADLFLINYFINPAATGIYVISVQLTERLWLLSKSVSSVILPRLSELHKDEDKRRYLTPLISRWVFFLTILAALLLGLLSEFVINMFFGTDYADAVGALLILLPGIIIGSMARILSNDIAARGKPEINLYVASGTLTINILANILLIPIYGINGAAIATSLTYICNGIVKVIIYTRITSNSWVSLLIPKVVEFKQLANYIRS